MQVRAVAKYVRAQPRKIRIVADELRGQPAEHSAHLLRYHRSKSAAALRKVLISAMANARENHGIDPENLRISTIMVDSGPKMKRIQARAMGRGNRVEKKTSHITVVVEEFEPVQVVRQHGTKAKPRPSFRTKLAKPESKVSPQPSTPKEDVIEGRERKEGEAESRRLSDVFGASTEVLDSSDLLRGIRMVTGMKIESKERVVVWRNDSDAHVLAAEWRSGHIEVSFAFPKGSDAYQERRINPSSKFKKWSIFAWKEEDGSTCTLREKSGDESIIGHWSIESNEPSTIEQYLEPIAKVWHQSRANLIKTIRGILANGHL